MCPRASDRLGMRRSAATDPFVLLGYGDRFRRPLIGRDIGQTLARRSADSSSATGPSSTHMLGGCRGHFVVSRRAITPPQLRSG